MKGRGTDNAPRRRALSRPGSPRLCEHPFVSIKAGSYARFRRALDVGNLTLVRAAATELPTINLDDALRICVLLCSADPAQYERAVIRWLGRLCLERRGTTITELRLALAAFDRLPEQAEEAGPNSGGLSAPSRGGILGRDGA
jgi:hypothetical protein